MLTAAVVDAGGGGWDHQWWAVDDMMWGYLLLLVPSLSLSMLGVLWSSSSSSPLGVVAIGVINSSVNDVVSRQEMC